jgi:hypothetical protein
MKIIKISFIAMLTIAQCATTMSAMQENSSNTNRDYATHSPLADSPSKHSAHSPVKSSFSRSSTYYGSYQDITEILYSQDSQNEKTNSNSFSKKTSRSYSSATKIFTRYFCCCTCSERRDQNYTLHQESQDS